MEERLKKYPSTDLYKVVDTIGVPHLYCITSRHVAEASDHFSGILGKEAIESAEKKGVTCGICKGQFKFSEHETALLIEVNFAGELKDAPGLKEYLLSIKDMTEADHFCGFAFKQI